METALAIAYWVLIFILVITSMFGLVVAYAVRCAWAITTSLPIATWLSFNDVLKLGYHRIMTTLVLDILRDIGTVSTRFIGTDEERWYVMHFSDILVPEGGEPGYHVGYPELYEYMLHRRPRRRKRIRELRRIPDNEWAPSQI